MKYVNNFSKDFTTIKINKCVLSFIDQKLQDESTMQVVFTSNRGYIFYGWIQIHNHNLRKLNINQ